MSANNRQLGQTLVLSLLFLSLGSSLLVGLFRHSISVSDKIRLQIAADMALLSALNQQAETLNGIAILNRAILSNEAFAAQLNALASESSFYRQLAERFRRIVRLVPYAGALSELLAGGARSFETLVMKAAGTLIPAAGLSSRVLGGTQRAARQLLPFTTLRTAKDVLGKNAPAARLLSVSRARILMQSRSLQRSLVDLEETPWARLRIQTLDRHTLSRNWRLEVAGISPVRKSGGTGVTAIDYAAGDKLRLKVLRRLRWRWKTVLSTRSNASSFGYRPPGPLLTLGDDLDGKALKLGITVQMDSHPLSLHPTTRLTAVSAAGLFYRRASRPQEAANVFNPFWAARLIPAISDPSLQKVVPPIILKEVRH